MSDFEKDKPYTVTILNKIPHIIPHKYVSFQILLNYQVFKHDKISQRVEILQNIVQKDKLKTFGEELSQIRIKIRRNRVVEVSATS